MNMDLNEIDKWKRAGEIAAKVIEHSKLIIKPGASLLKVTEELEKMIYELGAEPAFPVTIGLDHIAAHYAADFNDDIIFTNQVIKVDVGAMVDGYIGDTAITIDLSGKYSSLLEASKNALNEAIKIIKPGVTLGELGKVIQEEIEKKGFSPIKNLSGHGVGKYNAHTSPSIPNYNTSSNEEIKEGMVIAIEPFATNGKGLIKESTHSTIFAQIDNKPVRSPIARKLFSQIKKFNSLPFNYRWLSSDFSEGQIKLGIRQLVQAGILREHPPLPEVDKGIVSQFEHTVLVTKDETIVLTKIIH